MGRRTVLRNGYGRREIEDVLVVEEPMRLIQQLGGIARGVLALGLPATAAGRDRSQGWVALNSMLAARRAVLTALLTGEVLSTAGCARTAHLDRKVARMALEELAAIGVVENDRSDEEDDIVGAVHWLLSGDDGAVVAAVFEAHRDSGWGWDETWVYTSTSPQEREEDPTSTGGLPHFVPPLRALTAATSAKLGSGRLLRSSAAPARSVIAQRDHQLPPPRRNRSDDDLRHERGRARRL